MRAIIISAVTAFLVCLIFFAIKGNTNEKSKLLDLEEKYYELSAKISELNTSDVSQSFDISMLKLSNSSTVYLSPASKDYAVSSNDNGVLFFSLYDVSKYADGHKIILRIGNPNAVSYSDVKLTIYYGRKRGDDQTYDDWRKTLRQTSYTINGDLPAGTWSPFEIVLSPSVDEETGFIEVTPEVSTVALTVMPLR